MIRWTTAWRRKNKKLQTTDVKKKRRRRRRKVERAISGGMSVAEIQKRRSTKVADRPNVARVKNRNRNPRNAGGNRGGNRN